MCPTNIRRVDGGPPRSGQTLRFVWFFAAVAALLAFIPSLWAGYLADDFVMLRTIKVLNLPLQAFTHNDIGGTAGHPYRPLWVLANGAINGMTTSSVAHHLFNIALYAAAAVLVVVIADRFVQRRTAVLAGVLFALYPRQIEAVAWIAGSTDLLAGFFTLVALAALTVRGAPKWALAVGVVAGVAAPLAKESAFPIPALAILLVAALSSSEARPLVDGGRWRRSLTIGVVLDLLLRTLVIHGFGNDVTEPFGLHRLAVVLGSQLLATFTTSQMLVLEHPALLVIPVALATLARVRSDSNDTER